jgi:starch synthase
MEQGIISSDYVNTVSPTYAQEILLKEYSGALSELLQARVGRLTGILNGIDYTQFPRSYDKETAAFAKSNAKTNLQTELKLNVDNDFPLLSYIGRLDANQKGLDLIYAAVPSLVAAGGQFVLLGTGDAAWSSKFKELEHRFPGNVSVNILFDEAFSHDIYSASDFILIPSKYEPCGLVQMLAMWYGALPIVHYVGGLKDTVEDAVTGFCYHDQSNGTFSAAINRAVALFKTPASLDNMRKNAMSADWSWKRSAKDYLNLYHKIISLRGER